MRRRSLLLAAALPAGAGAGASACERPLRIGVSLFGWAAYQEGGRLRGIVPDLVERLATRVGCRIEPNLQPRPRALLDFQNGALDLLSAAPRSAERDAVGDFLAYAYSGSELLIRAELAGRIASVTALEAEAGLRLGLVQGIQLTPRLTAATERLVAAGRIEWVSDYPNLAARLQSGRLQAGIVPTVIHGKLRHDGLLPDSLRVVELGDNPPQPIGLYLHRRLPAALRQRLLAGLRDMVTEGEIERIYARHIGDARTRQLFEAGRAAKR